MAIILWGKPTITITNVSGSSANLTVPTPVADSTQLSTESGDKHTADIEGGGYEAIRYDKNSFTFTFAVRFAKNRTMPLEDKSADGVITGTYKIVVTSEETGAPTMTINEASARYEDEFSADDGARRIYTFESIMPASGNQIAWTHGSGSGSGQ
ncbi:MAG: hypothetical protein J5658_03810 [Prevotella sp.]|nr:hypothetical protein [Prevotella sp.]